MAMFDPSACRPDLYQQFVRPLPAWFGAARLGIFIHWGAYSVPAWAVPLGEHGTHHDDWFARNPYAEWYMNTIRIPGSPAQEHQREQWNGAPYDTFLDRWKAEAFDPDEMIELFARAGAGYIVPTTKHHDGITLWDAPGTGTRNTVHRGPHRDLVDAFERATRTAGLRFGVYYSGGLDWYAADSGPIWDADDESGARPLGIDYTRYANAQVVDLIDRYTPDLLWGDIDWPDAGKPDGPDSFAHVLRRFYAANPEGVINDRWGATHWDFRTSEYQAGAALEGGGAWENCRGIGLSFGYNRLEDDLGLALDGVSAIRHLVDVASRGGNLLLNVGPDAGGRIPAPQRACLETMAHWMEINRAAVIGTQPVPSDLARPGAAPWVRWTASADGTELFAIVDLESIGDADVALEIAAHRLRLDRIELLSADGPRLVDASSSPRTGTRVRIPAGMEPAPIVLRCIRR
jgi:alpha-L-fucosidase